MHQTFHRSRRGIALVIVLSMIVLITALVVSFTMSMRTERQVSHTMSENERVKLVVNAALAHAVSILDTNIPQPVPPGASTLTPTNWTVNPGMLNLIQGTSFKPVSLSTNPIPDYLSTNQDANINQLQPTSNQYPVTGSNDPMYVAWATMLQNPTNAASATNPIVARYAFWMDDENAKINVNTAYGKPSSGMDWTKLTPGTIAPQGTDDIFPLGHPASMNIDMLGPTLDRTALLNALKIYGAARSPEIIKTAVTSGDPEDFYKQNKFYLTATSRDPEFNVFGKSKIYMYAAPPGQLGTKLGGGLFQRFRDSEAPMYFHGSENRDPTVYPGGNPTQDYTAMYYTAANLSSILSRTDWPGMPTRSFVDKWGGNAAALREADQVAWNLVAMGSFSDYGDYTLATQGLSSTFGNHLPPGKTGSSGSKYYPNAAVPVGRSGRAIVPVMPRPMIDEICLKILPESQTVQGMPKYRLLFSVAYGVWLPPHYPATDFSLPSCDFFVGATHLEYKVKQDGVEKSKQIDTEYLDNGVHGIKKMQAFYNAPGTPMQPGARIHLEPVQNVVDPSLNPQWYARNGSTFNASPTGDVTFLPTTVTVTMRMRYYVQSAYSTYAGLYQAPPSQLIPVWDSHDPGSASVPTGWNESMPTPDPNSPFCPPADDTNDCVEFNFDLDLSNFSGSEPFTRSLRIADPRMGGSSKAWTASWQDSARHDLPGAAAMRKTDTVDQPLNGEMAAQVTAGLQLDKFGYVDMTAPSGPTASAPPHPSIGLFSLVPTGMQRGIPGSTLKLQPSGSSGELPDWLLLDLFAPTVAPPSASTAWADIVQMNSTAGKININAAIYPDGSTGGRFVPPQRLLPLQALLSSTSATQRTPVNTLAQNIASHTLASNGKSYTGAKKFYNYPGEICEVLGVADDAPATDFMREATVRNFASALTTKSNTFCVWGAAQTIKKSSTNHQYGQYETGDTITGEKRFQAIVERYVWSGVDGVPGNGHTDSNGTYDSLTQGATQPGMAPMPPSVSSYNWEKLDGQDAPTYPINSTAPTNATADPNYNPYNANAPSSYTISSLEQANNPVRALMKYRVIYFKYLD